MSCRNTETELTGHDRMRKGRLIRVCLLGAIILSVFGLDVLFAENGPKGSDARLSSRAGDMRIVVVYDNNPYKAGLETAWGFSCLVMGTGKTILFDTGGDGRLLLDNMKRLGVAPEQVDVVVLSHIHGDHTGGLHDFLEKNHDVSVYLPKSFPERFKKDVKAQGAKVVEVEQPLEICKHVYSTGELGTWIKEQSLVVRTDMGLIVITGCAHPGIVEIVNYAKGRFEDDVYFVMGGFHLGGAGRSELEKIVLSFKKLGVQYVGPCHCSGDPARKLFRVKYRKNFVDVGAGRVLTMQDLK